MATIACHYYCSEGRVALAETLLKLDNGARENLLEQLDPHEARLAAVSKQSMSQGSQLIVRRLE